MTDEQRLAYERARQAAIDEFPLARDAATRANQRIVSLRYTIQGTSGLLGLPIDQEYEWPQRIQFDSHFKKEKKP